MRCIDKDSKARKHTPPAPGRVNIPSHTFSPAISLGLNLVADGGMGFGRVRKKFRSGIGFKDDLTAGLVEEWNRVVDGARESL